MSEEVFTLRESGDSVDPETGEKREYETIPEGTILETEVLGLEKKVMPYTDDDGNEITKVEFAFRVIEEGEYLNRRLWGQTPTTFSTHEDCKLTAWIKEVLGVVDLPTGFQFRPKDLNGKKVRAVVGVRYYTPKGQTDQKAVNFVGDVMKSRSVASAPATPAVAPTAPAPTLASVASSLGGEEFGEEPF